MALQARVAVAEHSSSSLYAGFIPSSTNHVRLSSSLGSLASSSSLIQGDTLRSLSNADIGYRIAGPKWGRRLGSPCPALSFPVKASASATSPKKVLIINTNSGGHAVIGFWLVKELQSRGHDVTILTVGDESSDKMKKTPFSRFSELRETGAKTVWGSPSDLSSAVGSASFDVVLDNNGKDLEAVKPVVDWAKANGVQQFLFVSSAGIYKTTDEPPHVEGDSVKASAGHVGVEEYIASLSFSCWASFRPQYMVGSGNNKDCEEWFFDRIVRDRPVPIPYPGVQVTNISHVKDLSSMITLAIENPDAANGITFNAVSDRGVTFNGLVKFCAAAAGKEAKIVYYDPKAVGVDAKKAFPFRNMHFYAEPRAAKEKLGWKSTTNLPEDLKERFQEYTAIGRDKKDIKFELDDKILAALQTA
ncbi:hypothetical protein KP509_26G018800 [Ceratopteris richardii]|uniref:NAD-dependent epimerase/dehydratase domain-containing protein n=1 Tax=Ceratopteris richardii TaxID=49495 RepID=A0A8T2RKH5_CERRI|nr:hypothetical protein KP509_26G018800 [Ceratopteris richardii]